MTSPLGIGLIGCGTVGSGVARLLLEQPERLAARAGRALQLRRVLVRDLRKKRGLDLPGELFTSDLRRIATDPTIEVAVELVGGVAWAKQAVLDLLAAGKDVVTANKALLAEHGAEIFDAARRHGRTVAFEASVAGGIPIIAAFYAAALAEAKRLGYAETDPTLDVDGTDAAHKLAILAQIAFGVAITGSSIDRRGITDIQPLDIRYARELGYTIKLLAEAWLNEQELALHISPVLLRHSTPLAQVRGAYNAIQVVGDAVGDTLYYGKGAGQMPTASAVVADLIDLAVGRAPRTFQTLRLWSGDGGAGRPFGVRSSSAVRSRFYLRAMIQDRPGGLAEIARVLADHQISIASVIQHEAPEDHEGDTVPLVIMTHTALTGEFRQALADIDRLPAVQAPSVYYPVAD